MAPHVILAGLASIANDWKWLAIGWHVLLAALLVSLVAGWRPSARSLGRLLGSTLASVGAVAWLSDNPFNGTAFAIMAGALAWTTGRLSSGPIHFARRGWAAAGVALLIFGWTYPHFLMTESWATYLYAAPFALLPCPTLCVVIGMSLLVDDLLSPPWAAVLVLAGMFYGAFGVFRLGVQLDWALLLGSALLAAVAVRDLHLRRELVRHAF